MGWLEFLMIMILIVSMIAALMLWDMRLFGYATVFGILFVVGVFVMMQSPLGDQIRKEMNERKAAESKTKWAG